MKILYVASAIVAPGSHGGATHAVEVATELSRLGHEIHVICARPSRSEPIHLTLPVDGGSPIYFYRHSLPKFTAIGLYPWLARLAKQIKPDAVMERYYNFAGAGMLYAKRHGLPSLLEVNALMVDPASSLKRRLDKYALLSRLKWWAEAQCRWSTRIVTPLHTTVPAAIPREKIVELPWGANVEMFDKAQLNNARREQLRAQLGLPPQARVAVFAGSFRHWHGVEVLLEAAKLAIPQEEGLYVLFIGGGPLFETIKAKVEEVGLQKRIILTGPVEYRQMPLYLSLANVGVAPFDTSRHAPLREAGFFWSPLKIFEYMALELPSIVPDLRPLNEIIRSGQEGILFKEGDPTSLCAALLDLLTPGKAGLRREMGLSARARVVEKYSWKAHCVALDEVFQKEFLITGRK
jgi:glycosyltransferase involved in cell wall biosynthesis